MTTGPMMACALCHRTVPVMPDGARSRLPYARQVLAWKCQADGCACEPRYRAGITITTRVAYPAGGAS